MVNIGMLVEWVNQGGHKVYYPRKRYLQHYSKGHFSLGKDTVRCVVDGQTYQRAALRQLLIASSYGSILFRADKCSGGLSGI